MEMSINMLSRRGIESNDDDDAKEQEKPFKLFVLLAI